jgi:hypothetical protein
LTAIRETVYPCIEYAMTTTILSMAHVRELEQKLTAAIRRVLGLPRSSSLSYLIMPEDELGLGITSLEARYYLLTSTTFESILQDTGLVGQFSRALLRASLREFGCRQEAVAHVVFSTLKNIWLRKVHILTKLGIQLELPASFAAHADQLLGPELSPAFPHVLAERFKHARLLWKAGFFHLDQFAQPGAGRRKPFSVAEFCASFEKSHGVEAPPKLVAAFKALFPHLKALLAAQPHAPAAPPAAAPPPTTAPAPSLSTAHPGRRTSRRRKAGGARASPL